MRDLRVHILKIPKVIMRRLSLRHLVLRLGFNRMNDIRELDRVLNKEDRNVIPDNIPVSLRGIHLDGEPAHIAHRIRAALATLHSREPHEQRRLPAGIGQDPGGCYVFGALV